MAGLVTSNVWPSSASTCSPPINTFAWRGVAATAISL